MGDGSLYRMIGPGSILSDSCGSKMNIIDRDKLNGSIIMLISLFAWKKNDSFGFRGYISARNHPSEGT